MQYEFSKGAECRSSDPNSSAVETNTGTGKQLQKLTDKHLKLALGDAHKNHYILTILVYIELSSRPSIISTPEKYSTALVVIKVAFTVKIKMVAQRLDIVNRT